MSQQTFELARQLEGAFNSIGASMMSTCFAAKLLAYTYVIGGGSEAVVLHESLNAGIAIAQQKFNIRGGERPDYRGIACVRAFVRELERKGMDTPWLAEIYRRYGIKGNKRC